MTSDERHHPVAPDMTFYLGVDPEKVTNDMTVVTKLPKRWGGQLLVEAEWRAGEWGYVCTPRLNSGEVLS